MAFQVNDDDSVVDGYECGTHSAQRGTSFVLSAESVYFEYEDYSH